MTENTFGVPFDNCPDECRYLREVSNNLEFVNLQLIQALKENYYLRCKLERVRHEKHVYKVEMNRCRRKLERVYKYCDDLMTYEVGEHWKKEL